MELGLKICIVSFKVYKSLIMSTVSELSFVNCVTTCTHMSLQIILPNANSKMTMPGNLIENLYDFLTLEEDFPAVAAN